MTNTTSLAARLESLPVRERCAVAEELLAEDSWRKGADFIDSLYNCVDFPAVKSKVESVVQEMLAWWETHQTNEGPGPESREFHIGMGVDMFPDLISADEASWVFQWSGSLEQTVTLWGSSDGRDAELLCEVSFQSLVPLERPDLSNGDNGVQCIVFRIVADAHAMESDESDDN